MDAIAHPDDMIPPPDDVRGWVRENVGNLVVGAIILGVVLWRLHFIDVVLAAAGLTLIIFIHELGHFAAAKLCKVRVETFSIGFGPAIPFCKFQYGETTYKLAVIPLGGFVKMLGQEDGVVDDAVDDDPRSYKNQSVPERLFIISAGVIMNLILASVLFVVVYMTGLPEQPAIVGNLSPGGALWRHGVHTNTTITQIGNRVNPWFDDVRPLVWGTQDGDRLPMTLVDNGVVSTLEIEPLLEKGAPFPLIGFNPPETPTLRHHPRETNPPYRAGSAAAEAANTDKDDAAAFKPGDHITAMTDAAGNITPLDPTGEIFDLHTRMTKLAGKPVTVHVERKADAAKATIVIPAAYRYESGLRMRMGPVVAIRDGSGAKTAGVEPKTGEGTGDRIIGVEVTATDGTQMQYTSEAATTTTGKTVLPLDPLRLPTELNLWADRTPGKKSVKLTVLRQVEHTEKRVTLDLPWDERSRFDISTAGTLVPINGLGIAYQVQAVVDTVAANSSAATAGVQPGDTIEAVKVSFADYEGKVTPGRWDDVQPHQWSMVDNLLQASSHECELRLNRGGAKLEVKLTLAVDTSLPVDDRGLYFMPEFRIQKAAHVGEALEMGLNRTLRMIRGMYINLYAMAFGRVSAVQTMSGPITLARASYIIAGESTAKLILLLALISINLAVVNFLPIPVLDGGHVMFLLYEAIRGKPAPERVQFYLTILGLAMVGSLMLFVVGLDLWRLVKAWFL